MVKHTIISSVFLIFTGAAVLSTVALWTRQSLIVAYMVLGIILGPWGLKLVDDTGLIRSVSDFGIIFLLFLLGLNLPFQKLLLMLKKAIWVTLLSSIIFALTGYAIAYFIGLSPLSCWIVGITMMFSSTIIGIKLLPTTVLHHQHTGEVMISILLLQDLLAIAVLLFIHAFDVKGMLLGNIGLVVVGLPAILVFAYLFNRFVLLRLFSRFNRIKEYLFLLAIAWCLTMAQFASWLGLSAEIGAFIAGVALASSSVSLYIAESLKPIRDFFLVMFFFSVGATFDLSFLPLVIIPAIVLVVLISIIKPVTYRFLLGAFGENKPVAWEVGVRLGQVSEFSLIIAFVAMSTHVLADKAMYLIEATTMLSFVISSYWVVLKYPTPVAASDRLRRD